MRELIDDFLAQKRIAIVGVTRDEKGWGRALYREFKKRGYDVYAINPARTIPGLQCYAHLNDVPRKPDGVLFVVPPHVTEPMMPQVAAMGIPRVWMHRGVGQGAVSQTAVRFCQENKIAVIYGVCPLMYLKGSGFGHRLHHAFAQWRHQLPEDA